VYKKQVHYPRSADGKVPEFYAHLIDPFVALAIASQATSRIRIGTAICLLPERNVIETAKAAACIDFYSGGRLSFGIGAGWFPEEARIMGVDFPRRWRHLRESVEALRLLWSRDDVGYEGEIVKFPPVRLYPRPVQKPGPPILLGAHDPRYALRRVARYADGWCPGGLSVEKANECIPQIRKMAREEYGRDPEKLEFSILLMGTGDGPSADVMKRYAEAGVSRRVVAAAAAAGPVSMSFRQAALTGATLQMFTHGTITGMLFFAVGVLYDKAHTRDIDVFGGIGKRMPTLLLLFSVACFASLGLPGLSGFIAEYLVFTGSFAILPVVTILSAFGVVLTAGYLLWMIRRAFHGPLNMKWSWLTDATWAMPAVIIVYAWKNLGYAMVIYLAGMQSIPKDLMESATIDGAGVRRRFLSVTLPLLAPTTFYLLVTSFLASWQAFDILKVLTGGGPVVATTTLIYHMYEEGFLAFHAGRAASTSIVLFTLMLVATLIQVRFVERRVTY